ncbi:MAG TPA: DUF938 domain-containing protein [Geminicoccaceae bacterium]
MSEREPDRRQHAPAAARNAGPILDVLRTVLPDEGLVLEVGSGTGEHVVAFAAALPRLGWLPSDPDPAARASIAGWTSHAGLRNVAPPRDLDVLRPGWGAGLPAVAAVLAINLLHVAPDAAVIGLLDGAAACLPPGAPLLVYGPFIRHDRPTAPSNVAFDRMLRSWDPAFGLPDLDALVEAARPRGLLLERIVEMPANNLTLVLRRAADDAG